jgi:hypothetical protein
MKIQRLAFAILLISPLYSAAQTAAPQPAATPSTKLESFSSKTGIVIIKGFTTVGKAKGRGVVTVEAREFRDGTSPQQGAYGVAIEVKESGRLERESRSFIDYDEIDSLVKGIDYIAKIGKSVTQFNDFEAQYRTKGDFSITVFSDSSGGLSLSVDSGRIGRTSAFLEMSELSNLKALILEAKRVIDASRASPK